LFSSEWESGTALTGTLTATLEDYFHDIATWLPEQFFTKFVKEIFTSTVSFYVMALRKQVSGTFHFGSEVNAMGAVMEDQRVLKAFFEKYEEALELGGLQTKTPGKSAIDEELEIIRHMSSVIAAVDISGAEKNIKAIYLKYEGDGLRLVKSIISANPGMTKAERAQSIEAVTKMFDTGVKEGIYKGALSETFNKGEVNSGGAGKKPDATPKKSRFWGR
jgi:Exocyst complex component Sec6